MSDPAPGVSIRLPKPRPAGWGAKAILVCALAVLMAVPMLFVWLLVLDRANRSEQVVAEISEMQGGEQRVLGPLLVAPYVIPAASENEEDRWGWYVLSPETGSAQADTTARVLKRGIFSAPVYEATVDLEARFVPPAATPNLPLGARVDWTRAQVVIGFSDLRGGRQDPVAAIAGPAGETRATFAPATGIDLGAEPGRPDFGLMAAPAGALTQGGVFRTRLAFTGAGRLSVLPFAKSTRIALRGDWADPGFDGGFLPATRSVTGQGFTAGRTVPFMARGLVAEGPARQLSLAALGAKDVGVTFTRSDNPYQFVSRSMKYAVMFIGLVFLTFFVFEALSGRRLHAAQYILIGLAQMVFYLLLLSLSEHLGFDRAFLAAAAATVLLIGLYAGAAFRARRYQLRALGVFSLVYGLIYLLMRLEDFALLAGSVAAFAGLSAAMWLTRNIDWYGGRAEVASGSQQPPQ